MEEAKDISPGVSFPVERVQDMHKAPILVLCHSVVPLFYLGIKKKADFLHSMEDKWVMNLNHFGDNHLSLIEIEVTATRMHRMSTDNVPVGEVIAAFNRKRDFRNFIERNSLQFKHLNLRGYIDQVQVLRDVFIFIKQIPQT